MIRLGGDKGREAGAIKLFHGMMSAARQRSPCATDARSKAAATRKRGQRRKKRQDSRHFDAAYLLLVCHRSRAKSSWERAAASLLWEVNGKRCCALTTFMRGGACGGRGRGRRTNHEECRRAGDAVGVPAYELLQSITPRNREWRKKKRKEKKPDHV